MQITLVQVRAFLTAFVLSLEVPLCSTEKKEDEPPGVPTSVQHEVVSFDTISMSWKPPRDHNRTVVRGYTVGWGTSDHVDAMAISLEGEDSNFVRLDGLKPDTEYVITLSAFNDMGDGIQHREVIRTKPDPTEWVMSPTKVQAVVLSPTEVLLIWDEMVCDMCNEFGTPVYIIRYGVRGTTGHEVQVFVGSERQFLIANLTPDTEYEFAVKMKNRYGDSEWSSPAFARTTPANKDDLREPYGATSSETEEVGLGSSSNRVDDQLHIQNLRKNEAPTILRLFASLPNSLHIQWKRPVRSRRTITAADGVRVIALRRACLREIFSLGYQIFYKLWTDEAADGHDWIQKDVLGDLESYDLDISGKNGGRTAHRVDVKIRAITSLGPSPFSDTATCDFDTTPKVGFLKSGAETLNTKPEDRVARIKADSEINSLKIGDTFSISCVVTQGGHALSERWYFPNASLVPFDTGYERAYVLFLKNNTVLRLVVDFLKPEDSGYYTCGRKVSGHVLGESVYLHVHTTHSEPEVHGTTALQLQEELPPILCKFETSQSRWCDWKSDDDSEIRWSLVLANTYGRLLRLPPVKASQSSHYFLWHNIGSPKPKVGTLSSPIFPAAFSFGYCFSFSFAIGPRSRGRMNIYMQPYPADGKKRAILILNLHRGPTQAEAWRSCTVQLLQTKSDFKIIVQVISSTDEQLAVALDRVQLIPGACGSVCNGLTSSTTVYSTSPSAPPTVRERNSNHGTKPPVTVAAKSAPIGNNGQTFVFKGIESASSNSSVFVAEMHDPMS